MANVRVAGRVVEKRVGPDRARVWSPRVVIDSHPVERGGALLAEALLEILESNECARLAIPGGSALESLPNARAIMADAWCRVAVTWVDERCVQIEDRRSNRGAAMRSALVAGGEWMALPPPPACVLSLFEDGETPDEALVRVRRGLARDFSDGLDVVLLGMGADGHVASLFPSSPSSVWSSRPGDELVVHISDSPKPPADRITLTRGFLATARHVILVATGEEKRDALERLIAGDVSLPATGLDGLVIVTDLDLDPTTDDDADRKGG